MSNSVLVRSDFMSVWERNNEEPDLWRENITHVSELACCRRVRARPPHAEHLNVGNSKFGSWKEARVSACARQLKGEMER